MKTLRTIVGLAFVFAYLVYGGTTADAYCSPWYNPNCQYPSCSDSSYCHNGNYWEKRSCSWNESHKVSCDEMWSMMQTEGGNLGCGSSPWFGYVNSFSCYDTSDYPWECGLPPPYGTGDPDQCESVGSAECVAATGYC